MNISNVSRAASSNACATAAYITGYKIKNERTGEIYNYGRKQRVLDVATHLPANAPSEWSDPATLVNAIENYETKSNARVAKKIMVALPWELSLDSQKELTAEYCKQITKRGYGCICAIHTDDDNNNPHAHILIVNRPINAWGEFVATKTKKVYVLDEHGNRVPQIDKATGQQKLGKRNEKLWHRKTVKSNWIDERDALLELRQSWAEECNKWLAPEEQIDHRSHEERGLQTVPTIHEGYAARALEQRGGISERCEHNREIRALNDRILSLIAKVARQQERDKRAQQRAEQRQEIVDSVKDKANRIKTKMKNWLHEVKEQPVLTMPSMPQYQDAFNAGRKKLSRKEEQKLKDSLDSLYSDYKDALHTTYKHADIDYTFEKFLKHEFCRPEDISKVMGIVYQINRLRKQLDMPTDVSLPYDDLYIQFNYLDARNKATQRAQEAAQRTQTVKEQPVPTQEPQTPQRASESHIEPMPQEQDEYDYALDDEEDEYNYGLDDVLNECEAESAATEYSAPARNKRSYDEYER